ncbi:PEP-CTERM sorting domain-containing protein [Aquabacterium humicola]|uniref:PEP-CTERM sorting domain-containing protein n=1 Tax=Aquabacterium humicola TaxID=3237377 RepID=UPI00254387AA|nr:PEP-CTERM sorting domain-containing protein [Rubrivivax pictus]
MPFPSPRRLVQALAAPLLAAAALSAQAAPVSVAVSGFSFTPGGGYGVDAAENSGTLLDVLFSSAGFGGSSFSLATAGAAYTFDVGSVQLREANAHGGIRAAETDGLGVLATLTFASPFAAPLAFQFTGDAVAGSVSDSWVDLTLSWTPIEWVLADGAVLGIALNALEFTTQQTLTQTATVTLLQAAPVITVPVDNGPTGGTAGTGAAAVPEPSAWLLALTALGALGLSRRRRG